MTPAVVWDSPLEACGNAVTGGVVPKKTERKSLDKYRLGHWAAKGKVWSMGFVIAWYIIFSLRNGGP